MKIGSVLMFGCLLPISLLAAHSEASKPERIVVTPDALAPKPYVLDISQFRPEPNLGIIFTVTINANIFTNQPPDSPHHVSLQFWDLETDELSLNCPVKVEEIYGRLKCCFVVGEEHLAYAYFAYSIPNPKKQGGLIYLYSLKEYWKRNRKNAEPPLRPGP